MAEKILLDDWSFKPVSFGEPFSLKIENVHIDINLHTFLSSLTEQEELQLEDNIQKQGCINPLLVWRRDMNHWTIIDGHHRFLICKKHGIPFKVCEGDFENEAQVKAFMIENQLGRRNLTPSQLQYFRGIKYNTIVSLSSQKKKQVYNDIEKRERTCDYLAKKFSISRSTILRDAEFATGLDLIGRVNLGLKENILKGNQKIARKDVQTLAQIQDLRKLGKPKSVDDIKTKLDSIRKQERGEIIEIQRRLERQEDFAAINASLNRKYLDIDAKLNDLKGKVLSSMKEGIENKSVRPIKSAINHLKEMEKIIMFEK